ncbi:PulJ/GspJ family protein [Shewanella halifaxensis]|uniref:PulJ/GspJ family protein n=1 Tax=Shewanella halifaxensis TaxID=271098 RepID=UPI000D5914E6
MISLAIKERGFTLIELLISTALLSLILFIASFSYSLFATNWNKKMGSYDETTQFVRSVELAKRVLQSTVPLVINKSNAKKGLYFIGTSSSITAVSGYGFFSDLDVIYQISIEDSSDVEGGKL